MHTGVLFIGCLCFVCFVVQLLPVISVPITGAAINYNLHLSSYNNITYGVFGICDHVRLKCSHVAIGYPTKSYGYAFQDQGEEYQENFFSSVSLPSGATHSISKLLVVHVVAFILTGLLTLECFFVVILTHVDKQYPGSPVWIIFQRAQRKKIKAERAEQESTDDNQKRIRKSLLRHFSSMLFISSLSFLSTLLAFLADLILFIPRMSILGWIQVIPIALLALSASLLCFIKRSVSSRRHLDEEYRGKNDDMRNNGTMPRWVDDSASDDGFYVFTNGFYSSGPGQQPIQEIGQRRSSSLHESPTHQTIGQLNTNHSIDSHDIVESIELRRMDT
ncbi:uncharacterized protein CXQ87_003204 [Candidozyma duobushaemuli]|uniref:Pali-domain-containing protein n=2 Tax=Candidozyma TaxID=3303203 RepID=A0ABX8I5P4_9ASCO|nr:uncharacterized protein CXQ87_003204 [[Candida] duobushaemulonis]PVH15365.1 hypothetical protein CXQ87_003204 [[Candida] duobushaemulonis]QWU88594.1 hypothetical protein CA3LBN_002902 [[Candida] haemuloni]